MPRSQKKKHDRPKLSTPHRKKPIASSLKIHSPSLISWQMTKSPREPLRMLSSKKLIPGKLRNRLRMRKLRKMKKS